MALPASSIDDAAAFPPPDGTVALNLGAAAAVLLAVSMAVVFNWVALKGVISCWHLLLLLALTLPARTG